ncbi:MAG: V-type ATPase subunit [Oscillospiraceae bacterium]
MPSDSFPYANGRVRIIENSLLGDAKLSRLEELSYDEAARQLADYGFAPDFPVKTDIDAMIDSERASLRGRIYDLTPDAELTNLFLLDRDAINVKFLIKARLQSGMDFSDIALEKGFFEVEVLRGCVEDKDYSPLGENLSQRMDEIENSLENGEEIRVVSAMVDRAFYAQIMETLKKKKNEFCTLYFTSKIDYLNLMSLMRARRLGWDTRKLTQMLVDGGKIDHALLIEAMDKNDDEIARFIRHASGDEDISHFGKGIARAFEAFAQNDFESAFSAFSDALLEMARDERYDPFSIGPVAHYLIASEREFIRLRIIFAKKRAQR